MNAEDAIYDIVKREHPITVRGVFYRAVSAGLYDGTQQENYEDCAEIIKNSREIWLVCQQKGWDDEGYISYDWILDSSRTVEYSAGFSSLDSFTESIPDMYSRNHWETQPIFLLVMTEKDAMAPILREVIEKWNVPFSVFRGNPSNTLLYTIGKRLWQEKREDIVVLYLGDHDPSGMNISKTARKKVEHFSGKRIEWERVAINDQQFEEMRNQFGFPAKEGDRLKPAYVKKYDTDQCVEVDAIPSDDVRNILEDAIVKRIDMELWEQSQTIEQREQKELGRLVSKIRS